MEPNENQQLKKNPLRIQATILLISLVVQYAFGMYVNLFVQFPQNATQGQLWEFSWGQPSLATHIILGILIFIGSLVFLIRSMLYKDRAYTKAAILGFVGVLLASFGGSVFIPTQSDIYSYTMALAFVISFFAYAWGLYRARQEGH